MIRLRFLGLVCLVSAVSVSLVFTNSAASDRWPSHWQVNGNGVIGELEISIGESGTLTGRLFDDPVEGYVSGRHLVIRRVGSGDDRSEVWEGWLAQPTGDDSELIVAGTIKVSEGDRTKVYPWFGTQSRLSSASGASEPETDGAGRLSGHWTAAGGTVEIIQDGKNLTVILADGSSYAGRMTGEESFIVGLRKGCCNGELDGPDVISWSDGARWRRSD